MIHGPIGSARTASRFPSPATTFADTATVCAAAVFRADSWPPDFRERFIVAMMGEGGGGDPDYQGRFASANAAYRRAMTEYSNQFEKWGRQKLAAQNRAWAAAHPEEARKRRAAAEERKYQEQVDSAIREAMINSLRRIR